MFMRSVGGVEWGPGQVCDFLRRSFLLFAVHPNHPSLALPSPPLPAPHPPCTQTEEQKYSAVNNAAHEVERMIKGAPLLQPSAHTQPPPQQQQQQPMYYPPPGSSASPYPAYAPPPAAPGPPPPIMVFVNISSAPPEFGLNTKITGPGAAVMYRGITSSLKFHVQITLLCLWICHQLLWLQKGSYQIH